MTRFALGFVVAGMAVVPCVASAQMAGRIDAPVVRATAAPLSEAIVGDWQGYMYVADAATDFRRVAVSFRITDHGVLRYTRGPTQSRPVEDTNFANFLVFGDQIVMNHYGSSFALVLVGVKVTGDQMEFVIPAGTPQNGTLDVGGFRLTRQ